MAAHDPLHRCQAHAVAGEFTAAMQPREDAEQAVGRAHVETGAVVAHYKHRSADLVDLFEADVGQCQLGAVLPGIAEQVLQHQVQQCAVAHRHQAGLDVQPDLAPGVAVLQVVGHLGGQPRQVHRHPGQGLGRQPGQRQQRVDHAVHPRGGGLDPVEVIIADPVQLAAVVLLQYPRKTIHHPDRCPQVVRDGVAERGLLLRQGPRLAVGVGTADRQQPAQLRRIGFGGLIGVQAACPQRPAIVVQAGICGHRARQRAGPFGRMRCQLRRQALLQPMQRGRPGAGIAGAVVQAKHLLGRQVQTFDLPGLVLGCPLQFAQRHRAVVEQRVQTALGLDRRAVHVQGPGGAHVAGELAPRVESGQAAQQPLLHRLALSAAKLAAAVMGALHPQLQERRLRRHALCQRLASIGKALPQQLAMECALDPGR